VDSEYRIFQINDEGKGDFIWEFDRLSEYSRGPMTQMLLNRMKGDDGYRYDACLPNVLVGDILKFSSIFIDIDSNKKDLEASPAFITRVKLNDEAIMNTLFGNPCDEWLADTAFRYLSSGKNRVCVVLDMSCYGRLEPERLREEMDRCYRYGQDEWCYVFHHPEEMGYFRESIYFGLMMSYGFFATLPDSVSFDDIKGDAETPMSTEMAEMLARNADAVYVGSHDALRYMIGWFNPESIPY